MKMINGMNTANVIMWFIFLLFSTSAVRLDGALNRWSVRGDSMGLHHLFRMLVSPSPLRPVPFKTILGYCACQNRFF